MIYRCTNDTKYYSDKGIKVYKEWFNFELFLNYIGPMPDSKRWSIDRIDPNGNYEPGNVRWALSTTQNRNRNMFANNTSGDTGVTMRERNGNIRWIARWYDLCGKNCSKSFLNTKYEYPKLEAINYRLQMIEALNRQGADYPLNIG